MEYELEEGECPRCLEVVPKEQRIEPCKCKEQMGLMFHYPCLVQWMKEKIDEKCSNCQQVYKDSRIKRVFGSQPNGKFNGKVWVTFRDEQDLHDMHKMEVFTETFNKRYQEFKERIDQERNKALQDELLKFRNEENAARTMDAQNAAHIISNMYHLVPPVKQLVRRNTYPMDTTNLEAQFRRFAYHYENPCLLLQALGVDLQWQRNIIDRISLPNQTNLLQMEINWTPNPTNYRTFKQWLSGVILLRVITEANQYRNIKQRIREVKEEQDHLMTLFWGPYWKERQADAEKLKNVKDRVYRTGQESYRLKDMKHRLDTFEFTVAWPQEAGPEPSLLAITWPGNRTDQGEDEVD